MYIEMKLFTQLLLITVFTLTNSACSLNTEKFYNPLTLHKKTEDKIILSGRKKYKDNSDVYIVNGDGSNLTRLTNNGKENIRPTISPDKSTVAFCADSKIYLMNADGTNQHEVATGCATAWSPNGMTIAFIDETDNKCDLSLMNADGTNQRRVANGCMASWSPNGKLIAYHTYQDGNWEIYVMNADGTNQRNITNNPRTDTFPDWSPDSKSLVFHTTRDDVNDTYGANWEIYKMNADGTSPLRLTSYQGKDWLPRWSPNGAFISYWSMRNGKWELYFMNADGSNNRKISNYVGSSDVVWQSDWFSNNEDISYQSQSGVNLQIHKVNIKTNTDIKLINELDYNIGSQTFK